MADRFRQDLLDGGHADGRCAFRYDLPPNLSPADLQTLSIGIVGTDHFFPFRVGRLVAGTTPGQLYQRVAKDLRERGQSWRRFRTCILHIGTEKTGTTSLQNCLGLNRKLMADNGYFIPRSPVGLSDGTTMNHVQLAMVSMYDEKFDDDLRRQYGILNKQSLDKAREDLFVRFSQEVAEAPEACHTLVLSSEHCHSRLATLEEVRNLKDFLDHFCDAYRIVVYLRPQHELAISQYGMFIANGVNNIDMFPPLPPPPGYDKDVYTSRSYFDYRGLLERWADVFGAEAVQPRIYANDTLRGGDVARDFLADLSLHGHLEPPPRLNGSVDARGQTFLTRFFRHLDDKRQPGTELLRERIRNAVQACFPGHGPAPTRAAVAAFLANFESDNELVRARWFPQRERLFNVNLAQFPEVEAAASFGVDEVIDMFQQVLLMDQQLCFSLTPHALRRMSSGLLPYEE
ncbi:hypothetical protein CCS01_24095 [Rhodopila globiformis]|uniref:Sulfotransferase family protein n=1 Tax=Rhodopila globiformis TaxID=1071 RepID=A0A2S6N1W0_RHOGL|nr:hypothetical protein CCS01_24095 [Rhodopila globiformis]